MLTAISELSRALRRARGQQEGKENNKKRTTDIFSISIAPNWPFLIPYVIGCSYLVLLLISQTQILLFFTPISILLRWLSACSIAVIISGVSCTAALGFASISYYLRSLFLLLFHILHTHSVSELRIAE